VRRHGGWWLGALSLLVVACSGTKSASSTTTAPVTTSTTDAGHSQYCDLARQFSPALNPDTLNDPKTAFQEFDAVYPQFLAEVPAPIKADAETVVGALKQLEVSFQAVNYDLIKVKPADLAPVEAPSFTAATNAITTYDSQVCGITPPTT
jgi:hypothetical protein